MAPWLNWIEQPPPKGQVAGSSPAGVTILTKFTSSFDQAGGFRQRLWQMDLLFPLGLLVADAHIRSEKPD
jgi:hypothetical protein